jgi:5'-3' exonuclease
VKLLVDADYVVYKCCAAAETEIDWGDDVILVTSKFSEAYAAVKRELLKIINNFLWDVPELILFFSDSVNFRKSIQPAYKGHRQRKKPCGYKRVINQLKTEYEVVIMPTLEADDALGIYATKNPGNVICSPDKDMRQIPGKLFDMSEMMNVEKNEGEKWHLVQTLAGDQTDGYAGCPGIGVKRAITLFEEKGYSWKTVVEAFADKDLSEDVALENARLAKILTASDYDFDKQQPILWSPAADYRIDDGAGSKDEKAKRSAS